jgi:type VI secretion system ImpM family protein
MTLREQSVGACTALQVSMFGKLPWAADYVRIRHDHAAAIALDAWLSASQQPLARAGLSWPRERVRFLFSAPESPRVLAGVLAPSRDRAGRKFPLAIFVSLPSAPSTESYAALPGWLGPFFARVDALLARASSLDRPETLRALDELEAPGMQALPAALRSYARRMSELPARKLAQRLWRAAEAAPAPSRALHALSTARGSVADARAASREQAAVLDCPLQTEADVEAWLTLTRGATLPSAFWTPHARTPRLLLALGAVPAALPVWLAKPTTRHARLRALAQVEGPTESPLARSLRDEDWDLTIDRYVARIDQLLWEQTGAR